MNFAVSKKTPKFVSTKLSEYRLVGKRGDRLRKPPDAETSDDALPTMTANEDTSVARLDSDAPTPAQSGFNARDTLAGRLDDSTVRQAAGGDL